MTTYQGIQIRLAGGPDPGITRGGSTAIPIQQALQDGHQDVFGLTWEAFQPVPLQAARTGRLDVTGSQHVSVLLGLLRGVQDGRLNATGTAWLGRFIPVSAVYRNADRVTLAGLAVDLAGQPLRQVQLHFIGETVQQHFEGASTDSDGVYVAYLDTGDTYTAYAFHPSKGYVYQLAQRVDHPNSTTLTFRLLTRRAAFGEGLYLQGGTP